MSATLEIGVSLSSVACFVCVSSSKNHRETVTARQRLIADRHRWNGTWRWYEWWSLRALYLIFFANSVWWRRFGPYTEFVGPPLSSIESRLFFTSEEQAPGTSLPWKFCIKEYKNLYPVTEQLTYLRTSNISANFNFTLSWATATMKLPTLMTVSILWALEGVEGMPYNWKV